LARQSIVGRGLREVEKDFLTAIKRAGLLNAECGTRLAEPKCSEGGNAEQATK
jgi:hypothetical protein